MELNAVIFPAPQRTVTEEEFGDSLIWVPVYSSDNMKANPLLLNRLRDLVIEKNHVPQTERNIASSISSKRSDLQRANQSCRNVHISHQIKTEVVRIPQSAQESHGRLVDSVPIETEASGHGSAWTYHRSLRRREVENIDKLKHNGDNEVPMDIGLGWKRKNLKPTRVGLDSARQRVCMLRKASMRGGGSSNEAQLFPSHEHSGVADPMISFSSKRRTSAELARDRSKQNNSVKIKCSFDLEIGGANIQTDRASPILLSSSRHDLHLNSIKGMSQTSRSDFKPRGGPIAESEQRYEQSTDEMVTIRSIDVFLREQCTDPRRVMETFGLATNRELKIKTSEEMKIQIDELSERPNDNHIINTPKKMNSRMPVLALHPKNELLHTDLTKRSPGLLKHATHPVRKVPCLLFRSAKIAILNQSMADCLIVYLHGNAEDLTDASIIPRYLSNRFNVKFVHADKLLGDGVSWIRPL